jgi:hypothetical protein
MDGAKRVYRGAIFSKTTVLPCMIHEIRFRIENKTERDAV